MSLHFALCQPGGNLKNALLTSRSGRFRLSRGVLTLFLALLLPFLVPSATARAKEPKLDIESETRSPVTLYEIGISRLVLGDLAGADKAFRLSLGRADLIGIEFAPPHEGMARLLLVMEKIEQARYEANLALEIDRTWTPAYVVLGRIEEHEGNAESALAYYERGLALSPGDDELVAAAASLLRKQEREREAGEVEARARRVKARAGDTSASTPARAPATTPPPPRSHEGDTLTAATRERLRPFFPDVADQLSPRLLAVFQQPRLTRGALAVLAIGDGEHGIGQLLERTTGNREGTKQATNDTRGRPEERWIDRALASGVIEPLPDDTFQPDQSLSRVALALWVEEMIERIRRDPKIFTLYHGQPSPFSDLPAGHYALNAARLVTDLKLLPAVAEGRFGVDDPVSMSEGMALIERLGVLLAEPGPNPPGRGSPATEPGRN